MLDNDDPDVPSFLRRTDKKGQPHLVRDSKTGVEREIENDGIPGKMIDLNPDEYVLTEKPESYSVNELDNAMLKCATALQEVSLSIRRLAEVMVNLTPINEEDETK